METFSIQQLQLENRFGSASVAMLLCLGGLALVVMAITNHLLTFFFPRKNQLLERFPFASTMDMVMNQHRVLEFLKELFDEFAAAKESRKTFVVKSLGMPPMVFTNSVENITYVLKTNFENYGKSGDAFKPRFQGLLGDGIFNADGKQWYVHRKTSSHMFKQQKFRTSILQVFNEELDIVVGLLNSYQGKPFDFQTLVANFTIDSIGKIAFGRNLGCLLNPEVKFAKHFDYCTKCVNDSMVNPAWRLFRYFTPSGWRYFYCLRELNKFAFSVIREWRAEVESGREIDDGNLLSMYLNKENYSSGDHEDTFIAPTDSNLRDVILNIIIAGRDTTANALCWAFYRLCIHPEEQRKVREEAQRVLGSDGCKRAITYDQLSEMKYTEAFVMEVLRLHPSVPKEGKCCYKDDILPDGTPVKRGDLICFSPWVMGRDANLWESPLDFKPERFVGSGKPSPFVFTAFQVKKFVLIHFYFMLRLYTYPPYTRLVLEFALGRTSR